MTIDDEAGTETSVAEILDGHDVSSVVVMVGGVGNAGPISLALAATWTAASSCLLMVSATAAQPADKLICGHISRIVRIFALSSSFQGRLASAPGVSDPKESASCGFPRPTVTRKTMTEETTPGRRETMTMRRARCYCCWWGKKWTRLSRRKLRSVTPPMFEGPMLGRDLRVVLPQRRSSSLPCLLFIHAWVESFSIRIATEGRETAYIRRGKTTYVHAYGLSDWRRIRRNQLKATSIKLLNSMNVNANTAVGKSRQTTPDVSGAISQFRFGDELLRI